MGLTIAPLIHFDVIPSNGFIVAASAVVVYVLVFSLANAREAKGLLKKFTTKYSASPR